MSRLLDICSNDLTFCPPSSTGQAAWWLLVKSLRFGKEAEKSSKDVDRIQIDLSTQGSLKPESLLSMQLANKRLLNYIRAM